MPYLRKGNMKRLLTDAELVKIRDIVIAANAGKNITSEHIKKAIKESLGIEMDASTIRGRFIQMGQPLGGAINPPSGDATLDVELPKPTERKVLEIAPPDKVSDELKQYTPNSVLFESYIERPVDSLLAIHLDLGKNPIAQGKQGTGKTFSYMYYAYKRQLPFFLYSAYADFNLRKYFGDKTIENGTIKFQEGLFIKAISSPSVVLIDEVNAIDEAGIKDFNAFLQNRELYIKDADGGKGRVYAIHKDCRIGFAQNPKSAKYIGGKVRSSDFLGRCTYVTYPEFTKGQIDKAVSKRYPTLSNADADKFVSFYREVVKAIDAAQLAFDISIRQLNNVIDLWLHGVKMVDAIESGMLDIADASSQPKTKEALYKIAEAVWGKDDIKKL
jgi:MoxR-like ATPase